MSELLAGALSVLLATNKEAALTRLAPAPATAAISAAAGTNDPVQVEFRALLKADDETSDQVEKWLDALPAGAEVPAELKARIDEREEALRQRYEEFLRKNPGHAEARLAYGSFLGDAGDDAGMVLQWEKARELAPGNPAAWNNLAGHYAHRGPIEKAFPYMLKATELNPQEAQYWHSLGTLTFLFRRDAETFFKTDEQGVFRKAFEFYGKALSLQPNSFKLAADVAQTWYGVKPAPAEDEAGRKAAELQVVESGLKAWTNAFRLATDVPEREGVRLHFARWQIRARRWDEARTQLDLVSDPGLLELKARLERSWRDRQVLESSKTNAVP